VRPVRDGVQARERDAARGGAGSITSNATDRMRDE
jgi:hypothetical protein